ncbi:MAG: YfcE family phosphodiesterase [Eubacteriales bacterium]|nr:YfcE family phosphodiesterase [Eubacteriales bacterium]
MKILILSDSHGRLHNIVTAIKTHPDARYVLFLGDGAADISEAERMFCDKIFYCVRGNNDFYCDEPYEREICLEKHKILMLHGHTAGVKYGSEVLIPLAKNRNADIVLFGHTHQRFLSYIPECGIYLFNPGSVGEGGYEKNSYGILTLDGKDVLFSHSIMNQ